MKRACWIASKIFKQPESLGINHTDGFIAQGVCLETR